MFKTVSPWHARQTWSSSRSWQKGWSASYWSGGVAAKSSPSTPDGQAEEDVQKWQQRKQKRRAGTWCGDVYGHGAPTKERASPAARLVILPATHPPSFHRFFILTSPWQGFPFRTNQASELSTTWQAKNKRCHCVCVLESQFCFYRGPMLRTAVRVIPLKRLGSCRFRSECIQECFQNSLNV